MNGHLLYYEHQHIKFSCSYGVVHFQTLCKLLKNSIGTLVEDCVAILPAMLEIIPQIYEASLNSSLLDLVKQVSLQLPSRGCSKGFMCLKVQKFDMIEWDKQSKFVVEGDMMRSFSHFHRIMFV